MKQRFVFIHTETCINECIVKRNIPAWYHNFEEISCAINEFALHVYSMN